jgi:hypothetical protein
MQPADPAQTSDAHTRNYKCCLKDTDFPDFFFKWRDLIASVATNEV